ncbi:hypothetical protein [Chitinimonas sp.]|uniref:hypothetical protein n=1 Tax=Chitinimonas sp. TaxID=1934313 RepID=UPI0035AF868C
MSPRLALFLSTAIVGLLFVAMAIHGPIVQLPHYHAFADQRPWLGLPHAADVLSNLGFAVAGLAGLSALQRVGGRQGHGYPLFCLSLVLSAIGSAYYHWAPDDARLMWDRLPIALACAALLLDCWESGRGKAHGGATAMALILAVASVLWWHWGNQQGKGDLRPYLLLQGLPLLLIPLWQAGWQRPLAERRAFAIAIACYITAKLLELADLPVLQASGVVSGHTLKHVLASAGAAVIVWERRSRAAAWP